MKTLLLFVSLMTCLGCRGSKLVLDPSIQAVEAGDFTLMISGCEAVPGRGMDICRVKEGQPIQSVWRLVVPIQKNTFLAGELSVYYRDISKTYPLITPVVEIPWKDFFREDVWNRDMDGEALALAKIRWKTPTGIEEIWTARGLAKLVVTKEGYDPLPMDSGFVAWGTQCKIVYSTAGRSAIQCK